MLAKGKVFWSVVEWEDATAKQGGMAVWTARVTKIGLNILAIMACVAEPICRGMCRFMIHRWVKGFDKRSSGFLGTHTTTGCSAATGQNGQRAKGRIISLSYLIL
jgi:hypothetical protein